MLHVQVNAIPYGYDEFEHVIEEVYIVNDGSGNKEEACYNIFIEDPRKDAKPIARIENYQKGNGDLVSLVLEKTAQIRNDYLEDNKFPLRGCPDCQSKKPWVNQNQCRNSFHNYPSQHENKN